MRQRGLILVQFALLLVALLASAALVVDVGLALLAQASLQTAADSAALEGLRFRDADGDEGRRARVAALVARSFDDDLDPSNGDALNVGAGPLLELSGGEPGSNALATLSAPSPPVYDPVLEANFPDNAANGDQVAGSFEPGAPAFEDPFYGRTDFDVAAPAGAAAAPAFLVRLRRTPNLQGQDVVPGVASSGPPLPLLFGLGSALHGEPAAGYQPREQGIAVRGTAIAATRRALAVYAAAQALEPRPLLRVAIAAPQWQAAESFTLFVLPATGVLRAGASAGAAEAGLLLATAAERVGAAIAPAPDAALPGTVADAILAIYAAPDDRRVIGFCRAAVSLPAGGGLAPAAISFSRREPVVAANASAVAPAALLALASDSALLAAHGSLESAVYAAALVR